MPALVSAAVNSGDPATAANYNNLRTDLLGHNHDSVNTAPIVANALTTLATTATVAGIQTLLITPGAHTAVVAEVVDVQANSHTMTITGGYATQRFSLFSIPTISAASALTVTNAATVAIAGAPVAAGSAVITNAYALWVQAGNVLFAGNLTVSGTFTQNNISIPGILTLTGGTPSSTAGSIRLPSNALIGWRNSANNGDQSITFDATDRFAVVGSLAPILTVGAAGAAAAPPATPQVYWRINVNGVAYGIALYNP